MGVCGSSTRVDEVDKPREEPARNLGRNSTDTMETTTDAVRWRGGDGSVDMLVIDAAAERSQSSTCRILSESVNGKRSTHRLVQKINSGTTGSIWEFYKPIRNIARGGYSDVIEVESVASQRRYAVKCMDKTRTKVKAVNFENEVECLQRVAECPYVVHVRGAFESEHHLYLIMELGTQGDLLDFLRACGPQPAHTARWMAFQLATAVHHMHTHNVVHRDLKPDNVLVSYSSSHVHLQICDFGLSSFIEKLEPSALGTAAYSAPEVLLGVHQPDEKADMWAVGLILYMIMGGYHPFNEFANATTESIRHRMCKGDYHYDDIVWLSIPKAARDVIDHCLDVSPRARWSAADVLDSPWLRDVSAPKPVARPKLPSTVASEPTRLRTVDVSIMSHASSVRQPRPTPVDKAASVCFTSTTSASHDSPSTQTVPSTRADSAATACNSSVTYPHLSGPAVSSHSLQHSPASEDSAVVNPGRHLSTGPSWVLEPSPVAATSAGGPLSSRQSLPPLATMHMSAGGTVAASNSLPPSTKSSRAVPAVPALTVSAMATSSSVSSVARSRLRLHTQAGPASGAPVPPPTRRVQTPAAGTRKARRVFGRTRQFVDRRKVLPLLDVPKKKTEDSPSLLDLADMASPTVRSVRVLHEPGGDDDVGLSSKAWSKPVSTTITPTSKSVSKTTPSASMSKGKVFTFGLKAVPEAVSPSTITLSRLLRKRSGYAAAVRTAKLLSSMRLHDGDSKGTPNDSPLPGSASLLELGAGGSSSMPTSKGVTPIKTVRSISTKSALKSVFGHALRASPLVSSPSIAQSTLIDTPSISNSSPPPPIVRCVNKKAKAMLVDTRERKVEAWGLNSP